VEEEGVTEMSTFSTQHYNKIGEVFSKVRPSSAMSDLTKRALIYGLTKMFEEDNPKFNKTLFIDTCYDREGA
jgi:hypothetical protein